jgi:hypothetical protein
MKKSLWATSVAALVLGILAAAFPAAAEEKPLAVVSFAGYDQLLKHVEVVGGLAGRPEIGKMLDGLVALGTGGKGIVGLDKSKPWVVGLFPPVDNDYPVLGFIPVTDLKQFVSALPLPGGDGPPTPDEEGVYEIKVKDKTVYAKQDGKSWARVADSRHALKVEANVEAMLGKLNRKNLINARFSVQNVPKESRDQALTQLKFVVDLMMQGRADVTEEQTAAVKQFFSKLETLSNELDGLTLGLGADAGTSSIHLDLELTALPGTETARQLAGATDAKTNLAGFLLPGAAMTGIFAGTSSDEEVAQAKKALGDFRAKAIKAIESKDELEKEKQALAKRLLGDVLDVLNKSLDTKKKDAGMALVLDGGPTFVAGMALADGEKLEKVITEVLADQPNLVTALDIKEETYGGITFHVATVPIPDEKAQSILGEHAMVVAGFGKNVAYVGAGKDPIKVLKRVIDGSKKSPDKSIPAMQVSFAAAPIARFIAKVAPKADAKQKAAKVAEVLAKSPGKDHVTLTSMGIPNGVGLRLNLEEGIFKAIAAGAAMNADATDDN